jgi:hypothetical protein
MIKAQDQEIQSLIADIHDGKLLLPEMQRAYVWKSTQVRDLFDSLYHEYPSGQLLVWETDDLPIGNRAASIEGVSLEQKRPQLLLDGQQRLTSLTAIMLGRPLHVRDTSRNIDIAFNIHTEKFEVVGPRQRAQTGWVSLTRLFTQGMATILADLRFDFGSPDANEVLERLKRLESIKKYKYRVNILDRLSYAEVTHIFVRTNSGGTRLGYGDLALAQVSSSWRGVTKELEEYLKAVKKKGLGLELDNGILLRAIAVILTKQSRFVRFLRTDHQELTVDELKAGWVRAKNALDRSLAFLEHNCKIDRMELLPTRSVLMPLVAFFDRYGGSVSNTQLRDLQRWVYMALIWSRYSGSSETAMDQDIAALDKEHPIQAMIQNIEDVVGKKRPITENELRDQRKNSPYMLMFYILARLAQAQDWFKGTMIGNSHTSDLILHHIFPKTLLGKQYKLRDESRIVDQVANLVFLSAPLSTSESNRAPVDYLPKIEEQRLKAQYVPMDPKLWQVDQFEECMRQRRIMLADAINQLLQSLAGEKYLITHGPAEVMEARVSAIEQQLRQLVERRLSESWGESAWKRMVPDDIRSEVQKRIAKQEASKPYEMGQYETLAAKLMFCQFSDYFKIIKVKTNWPTFEDVFGTEEAFAKYGGMAIDARNALKHGRDLTHIDLAAAEAGLSWLEECLAKARLEEESEEEMNDVEVTEEVVML